MPCHPIVAIVHEKQETKEQVSSYKRNKITKTKNYSFCRESSLGVGGNQVLSISLRISFKRLIIGERLSCKSRANPVHKQAYNGLQEKEATILNSGQRTYHISVHGFCSQQQQKIPGSIQEATENSGQQIKATISHDFNSGQHIYPS